MPSQEVERGSGPRGRQRIGKTGGTATGSQLCGSLTGGFQHPPTFFQRQIPQSPELRLIDVLMRLRDAIDGG